MGPVTPEEYESRQDRYDSQLAEVVGFDPEGKSTEEKLVALKNYRLECYEKLKDAVYKRRGWDHDGVPTPEKVRALGIDFPDIIELITK
jgi:aldehyde:ferredoxin oxidoreductase